ncbi:MAG: rubrerythrin [Geobacter sp.]|nr:rubrerythrin [Geobacter sp.]
MPEIIMTMSEQILLEKCRETELLCKELYEYFAELYSSNRDAYCLWSKTAKEEENHAAQFTLALKLRKGMPCMVTVGPDKIESINNQIRAVIAKVKVTPPKLADALSSSIKLERFLAEFHLSCVVVFEDESYKKMFNAMMASDQEHIASLQSAYDTLTGRQDWSFTS